MASNRFHNNTVRYAYHGRNMVFCRNRGLGCQFTTTTNQGFRDHRCPFEPCAHKHRGCNERNIAHDCKFSPCRITAGCQMYGRHAYPCQLRCQYCADFVQAPMYAAHSVACAPRSCANIMTCDFIGNKQQVDAHSAICESRLCEMCDCHIGGIKDTNYYSKHRAVCAETLIHCPICDDTYKRCNYVAHYDSCLDARTDAYNAFTEIVGGEVANNISISIEPLIDASCDSKHNRVINFARIMDSLPGLLDELYEKRLLCTRLQQTLGSIQTTCIELEDSLEKSQTRCQGLEDSLEKSQTRCQGLEEALAESRAICQDLRDGCSEKDTALENSEEDTVSEISEQDTASEISEQECHPNIIFHDGTEGWCPCAVTNGDNN
jgi:hypothetical protein